jgi:hypothetical protein
MKRSSSKPLAEGVYDLVLDQAMAELATAGPVEAARLARDDGPSAGSR